MYKPVPIEEFLVYDNSIHKVSSALTTSGGPLPNTQSRGPPCRWIEESKHKELSSSTTNSVVALAMETVQAGFSALIFCSSRLGCQKMASMVSEVMFTAEALDAEVLKQRSEVLSNLRSLMMLPLDDVLAHTVMRGVAFYRKPPTRLLAHVDHIIRCWSHS